MAYRTFVDKDGSYWQAWDSQPTKVERRTLADRRKPRLFPWRETERRSGQDRRVTSGWLTFESLTEKRRLLPIPSQWETMSQGELRALCEKAKRIAKVDESAA
jgi:hypothetical protein